MDTFYPVSTFHLRTELEGYPLDYIVKVDLTGWVYECKAVIFDLPDYVQQMMLYDRDEGYRERIVARGVLFKYEIVMGLAAKYTELKGTMGQLVAQIKAELTEAGTEWEELPITESTPPKMVYLRTKSGLSSTEVSDELIRGFQTSLQDLIFAVNSHPYDNDDDNILGKAIDFIGRNGGPKGHDILLDFLPVFPASSHFPDDDFLTPLYQSSVPQLIYKALVHEQSASTYAFMIAALQVKQSDEALHAIFENLKLYDSPDTEAAVLEWYHSSGPWDENTRPAAAIVLARYPSERNREIVFEAFVQHFGYSTVWLVETLLSLGYPQEEIVGAVWPVKEPTNNGYRERPYSPTAKAFVVLAQLDTRVLPFGSAIWSTFIECVAEDDNLNHQAGELLLKVEIPDMPAKVLAALEHDNLVVRINTTLLLVFIEMHSQLDEYIDPWLADIAAADIDWAMHANLTAGDDILWNVTTGFLQGRTTLLTATALLDTLFNIPFEPDEDYKNLDILRLMEEVFSYTPYDERATPMCLLSLNSENEYLRGAAVNVLGFSGDREILTALEDYLTDSAVVVRQTAQRVLGLEIEASTDPDFEDDFLNWDWD